MRRGVGLCVLAVTATACRFHFDELADVHDVGGDGDVPLCARPTTLVCDDYDAGISPAAAPAGDYSWLPTGGRTGGALRLRGTAAVTASADYVWPVPVTAGPLYARVYARVLAGPPIQNYVVLVELNNNVATGGLEKVSADVYGGDIFAIALPFAGLTRQSSRVVTRDAWTCIVVAIVVDVTAGTARLLVDSAAVVTTMGNTQLPGGFVLAGLGVSLGNADPDTEVWFDDFVVAVEPLGC